MRKIELSQVAPAYLACVAKKKHIAQNSDHLSLPKHLSYVLQ
jgi:hypothetical protein